jgi:uncharacterized repeat protein (TIGR01451 family)
MKNLFIFLFLFATSFSFAQISIGQPDDIIIVESPFDGFASFDLTLNENQTLNGIDPETVNITYYQSQSDALASAFAITNPTAYTNVVSPQSIWVRVELNTNPDVFDTVSFDISVESTFFFGQPEDLIVYELPFDGLAQFNLTQNESNILAGVDPSTLNITYHNTQIDADASANPIVNPSAYFNTGNPETVFVRIQLANDPNFFSTTTFNVEVSDDVVNIPSGYFLSTIINQGVDTNNSGNIQSFEALAVTSLSIDDMVNNVTGLEAFTNITELNANTQIYSFFDLSLLPLLERLEIFTAFGSSDDLDLSNNLNLKSLILINSGVTDLDLSNNILLEELMISSNGLTSLDLRNNPNLQSLSFTSMFLETVFIKNGADESLNMDSGSWLENWLPNNNPSLQFVCADSFQVAEIQNIANGAYAVNTYCSTQPGGDYNTIIGNLSFDNNSNGCNPSNAPVPFANINYSLPDTEVTTVSTNSSGSYSIYLAQPGVYTLEPNLEHPTYFNINPISPTIDIPTINNGTNSQDFCLTANGNLNDAEVVIAPLVPSNPGFDATYRLVYKNKGNQTLSGNVTFEFDDTVLDFVSSTVTPDVQLTGILTYNFTNLLPFENRELDITLNVNGPMETPPVNIDDVLDFTANINIDQAEETPEDNTFNYSEVVVASFDPNDILCLDGDVVPETEIGEFLHYLIRFENTGTAPAQQVIVTTDINPLDYNISSLQVLSVSHDMYMRNNDGVIEFVFDNIQLAGSGGRGNILLKIKTLPTLTINDEVDLQAEIYFDFNFPIVTNVANTAFEVLSTNTFETDTAFEIYPNPSGRAVNLKSNIPIESITIFDLQGRMLIQETTLEDLMMHQLDISQLIEGVYFIQIETSKGLLTQKLIKQ